MSENLETLHTEELAPVETDTTPEVVETVAPVVEQTEELPTTEEIVVASHREDEAEVYSEPVFDEGFLGTCERALYKAWKWIKKVLHLPDLTKKQKAAIWDKITTGILIALFATPFAVLIYILMWFIMRNV